MLATLVCQILSCSESNSGCDDALNGGVIGQIQEQHSLLHGTILLKILQMYSSWDSHYCAPDEEQQ